MGTLIISLCKDYLHLNSFLRCYVLLIYEVNILKVIQNGLPSRSKKKRRIILGYLFLVVRRGKFLLSNKLPSKKNYLDAAIF